MQVWGGERMSPSYNSSDMLMSSPLIVYYHLFPKKTCKVSLVYCINYIYFEVGFKHAIIDHILTHPCKWRWSIFFISYHMVEGLSNINLCMWSLHLILEEHGESFKIWTPIYERILMQIFVLATAYITITSKLAEIFQILINLSEVIFFAATMTAFKWMFELSLSMSRCWSGPSFALAMNYLSFVPNKYWKSQSIWTYMGRFYLKFIFQAQRHSIFSLSKFDLITRFQVWETWLALCLTCECGLIWGWGDS